VKWLITFEVRSHLAVGLGFTSHAVNKGDRGGSVVKALCYKSEGRWFDPS